MAFHRPVTSNNRLSHRESLSNNKKVVYTAVLLGANVKNYVGMAKNSRSPLRPEWAIKGYVKKDGLLFVYQRSGEIPSQVYCHREFTVCYLPKK